MKASVVEIHKNYCIVFTADGRFIRQDIPAGAYEVGDEIIVDAAALSNVFEKPLKKPFSMIARLAAGFAAIVFLTGGAYLGIRYAGLGFAFTPVKVASEAAQAKTIDSFGQEDIAGSQAVADQIKQTLTAEAPDSESSVAGAQSKESTADAEKTAPSSSISNGTGQSDKTQSSQDSSAAASDTNNEGELALVPSQVLFEGAFKLDKKNIDVLIDYPDLYITYSADQSYTQDSNPGEIETFVLKIKNLQKSTFIGNIDIIFTDINSSTLQTSAIETGNLMFNDVYTQQIIVAANADSFRMTLYGSFNEP